MKKLIVIYKYAPHPKSYCFMLYFLFFSLNFSSIYQSKNAKCSDLANVDNLCKNIIVDTRLCGIYGGGTPDKIIGSNINSDEDISDYYSPVNGVVTPTAGHLIHVFGTLRIDNNFRGNNLRFKMDDGARIIIEDSKSFYAAGCKFFSCNEMWRGIEAPNAKSISLISCKIEDAEYAFSVGSTTGIGLLNNDFTLNFVGFRNLGSSIKIGACIGNSFKGIDDLDLRPHYNSDSEIVDHYDAGTPYAGFLLNNCATTIGRNNGSTSFTFSLVVHGVKLINSSATVYGAHFNNIYSTELDLIGAGIYSENSHLVIGKCNFSDNYFSGIYTYASHLSVNNCNFTHCANGIFSEFNILGEIIDIDNNIFTMNSALFQVSKTTDQYLDNFGIWMSRSAGAAGLINSITSNEFYISDDNTNAFSAWIVEQSETYGGEQIRFHENKSVITSSEDMVCGYKIQCYHSNNVEIDFDTFYFYNPSRLLMRNGITAHSFGTGHRITNNYFESDSAKTMNIGFYGGEFANAYYCDNYFKYALESFYFYGNCDRSLLSTSRFDKSFRGVYIRNHNIEPGRIGKQDRRGNEWDCPLPLFSEAAYNSATKIIDSEFIIETTNCMRYPETGIGPNRDWFSFNNSYANDCSVPSSADSCGPVLGLSSYDWAIINGNYPEGPSGGIAAFNADYRLLERIILKPSLLNCDTSVQNYWDTKSESSAALLSGLLTEIREALMIQEDIQEELLEIYEEQNDVFYSLDTLYENHNWQDSLGLDSIFQYKLGQFLTELTSLKAYHDSLYVEITENRLNTFEDLEEDNENISVDSIWETNLKSMNTFIIHLLSGTADSADYANVASIAGQDFGEGGPAVLHARVWFEGEDEEEALRKFNEEEIIRLSDLEVPEPGSTDWDLEIYPNPIKSDKITIRSSEKVLSANRYDLTGHLILQKQMNMQSEIDLDVSKLTPGVYLLKIELANGQLNGKRIIIQ